MTKAAYRRGAVGALMDEYERAVRELVRVLEPVSESDYKRVRDTGTQDDDCRSIQMIMTHVIRAGFGYAGMMRDVWEIERASRSGEAVERGEVTIELSAMLEYMSETLGERWDLSAEEACSMKMQSRWGPVFDFEQLFEHAIVHILRHRRQIERFLSNSE